MFLFLHGTAATNSLWLPQIRGVLGLDQTYKDKDLLDIFTISFPGHPNRDKDFDFAEVQKRILKFQAEKLEKQREIAQKMVLSHSPEIIQALRSDKLTLIGHSVGGANSMLFALNHTDLVDRVVAISAGNQFNGFVVGSLEIFYKILFKLLDEEKINKLADFLPPLRWKVAARIFAENPKREGFWSMFSMVKKYSFEKTFKQFNLEKQLNFMKVPVLIINGEFDLINTPWSAEKVKKILDPKNPIFRAKKTIIETDNYSKYENCTVKIYPWIGHNPMDDDLVSFVYDVRQFLKKK